MRRSIWLAKICILSGILLAPNAPAYAGEWRYIGAPDTAASATAIAGTQAETNSAMPAVGSRAVIGDFPRNNMAMNTVRSSWGPPDAETAPVGDPPIIRWYYAEYTVYFEIDRVITSVVN